MYIIIPIALLVFVATLERALNHFVDRKRLRRFPPLAPLCGFTNLAYMFHNARGRARGETRTEYLLKAHQKHRILRLGPNCLSFADTEAINAIYGTSTACQKGDQYTTPGGTPNILSVVSKPLHAVKRKRLSAAFASIHLLDWEFKVADKVSKLLRQIDKQADAKMAMDFRYWSNLFTFDAILDIAVSQAPALLETGSDIVTTGDASCPTTSAIHSLRAVNRANEPLVWSSTCFHVLKALSKLVPSYRQQWKLAGEWQMFVRHIVNERLELEKDGESPDDLFSCLLKNTKGEKLELEEAELAAETTHLYAGSDTTSIALTHVLYCLAKHPKKLCKLREEIDASSIDSVTDVPSYSKCRELPYLRACLDEAMRLRPSLSPGMQRETPAGGIDIAGKWVAGNTMVSVAPFVAHRDAKVFPEPDHFIPERWLHGKSREFQKYILTFSAGARVCIGKNLTYLEQTVLIAAIVKKYDFHLVSSDWKMEWEEFFNTWPKELPVVFRQRKKCSAETWRS